MRNITTREEELTLALKRILDPGSNFVRPLSEFWKGCTKENCMLVGHYGLWFSGEGSTTINGEYAAYYYDRELSKGCPELQKFMTKNKLKIRWYDCGTPIMIFEDDEI